MDQCLMFHPKQINYFWFFCQDFKVTFSQVMQFPIHHLLNILLSHVLKMSSHNKDIATQSNMLNHFQNQL